MVCSTILKQPSCGQSGSFTRIVSVQQCSAPVASGQQTLMAIATVVPGVAPGPLIVKFTGVSTFEMLNEPGATVTPAGLTPTTVALCCWQERLLCRYAVSPYPGRLVPASEMH